MTNDYFTLRSQLHATHDRAAALAILSQIANLPLISKNDLAHAVHEFNQKKVFVDAPHEVVVYVAPTAVGVQIAVQAATASTPAKVTVSVPDLVVGGGVTTPPSSGSGSTGGGFTVSQNPVTNPVLTGGYLDHFYSNPANWDASSGGSSW